MNPITQIRQYGVKNSIIRFFKLILRKTGIIYEEYLYCTQVIPDLSNFSLKLPSGYSFKKLDINDYLQSELIKFHPSKISLFRKRLQSGTYKAYGIYNNRKLIYSCWISLDILEMGFHSTKLRSNVGLLVDAICHSDYRGLGIHSKMNILRLSELQKEGKSGAVVLLLKENIPARKSQKKAGFDCKEIIKFTKIGKRCFIKKKLKKKNLLND